MNANHLVSCQYVCKPFNELPLWMRTFQGFGSMNVNLSRSCYMNANLSTSCLHTRKPFNVSPLWMQTFQGVAILMEIFLRVASVNANLSTRCQCISKISESRRKIFFRITSARFPFYAKKSERLPGFVIVLPVLFKPKATFHYEIYILAMTLSHTYSYVPCIYISIVWDSSTV